MKRHTANGQELFGSFGDVIILSRYTFFQRPLSELKIRYDNEQSILIILFIFFGRCYKQILKNVLNLKKLTYLIKI